MRSSRGMGAMRASKMPKGKTITRKDNPDKVKMFAKGGKVKKLAAGGGTSDFGKAFRAARSAGKDEFTWNGKKYTTEMKGEGKAKAAPAPAAKAPAAKAPAAKAPVAKAPAPAQKTTGQMYKEMMSESRAGIKAAAPKFGETMRTQLTTSPEERRADAEKAAASERRGEALGKFMGRLVKGKSYEEDAAERGMAKGGKWIQGAIKKPGALHEQLGVPKGKKIPAKKLAAAAKAPGKLGQRARFAETLKKMRKK